MKTLNSIETSLIAGGFDTLELTSNSFMPVFDAQISAPNMPDAMQQTATTTRSRGMAFDIINPTFITYMSEDQTERNTSKTADGLTFLSAL